LLTDSASQEVRERLHLVESVRDGLELAEADLRLRGPGDYFGTRQSGLPALRQARLTDVDILELARADAVAILDRNRTLEGPEMAELKRRVGELAARAGEAN
jgi:ATP-dependent DNA helicase RecG